MDVSELRKGILRALEDARRDAAARREAIDNATVVYGEFLSAVAEPLFRQAVTVLRAEHQQFSLHTPAGKVRLVSDAAPETFAECEALFTAGRWLLSPPLVETALCWLIEPHAKLATFGYAAGCGEDALEMIAAALDGAANAGLALYMPTWRTADRLRARIRQRWPDMPVVVVNERAGTCLAAAPLLGLQLLLAQTPCDPLLCLCRWGDAWTLARWPRLPGLE